jgi:hypothetical protein
MGKKMTMKPTRNHIIVANPVTPLSTTIQITEEVERKHALEQLKKAEKATILATGPACMEVKVGDVVRIRGNRFATADLLEDDKYLLFNEGDVTVIY